MKRLLRIEADYFCFGIYILENNTVHFPTNIEFEAILTYKAFLDGLPLDNVLKVCERMGWQTDILEIR